MNIALEALKKEITDIADNKSTYTITCGKYSETVFRVNKDDVYKFTDLAEKQCMKKQCSDTQYENVSILNQLCKYNRR